MIYSTRGGRRTLATIKSKKAETKVEVKDIKEEEVAVKEELNSTKESDSKVAEPSEADLTSFSQLDTSKTTISKPVVEEVKESEVVEEKNEETKDETSSTDDKEETPQKVKAEIKQESDEIEETSDDKSKISSTEVKEWLKDVRPDTTKEVEKTGSGFFKKLFIFIIILFVIGTIAGGFYYYNQKVQQEPSDAVDQSQEEPVQPTPTVSEEETEEVDLTTFSLSILNGSGIAGEASKVSGLLEENGFENIETGNADSYDYTTTQVSLKEGISNEVYKQILSSLEESYVVEKSDQFLDSESSFDIVIIIGTQKP